MGGERDGSDEIGDPYGHWIREQNIPIIDGGLGIDLATVETAPWARTGCETAIVLLEGRGDFVDLLVTDLAPGMSSEPQRHLFEEVVYVLSGHGSTVVVSPDGGAHSFEWGAKSLFSLPMNARYRHFNTSGTDWARLAALTSLPVTFNLFRDERFIFDNTFEFTSRFGATRYFAGEGTLFLGRPGRDIWKTNFVPDLSSFALRPFPERGAGGNNMLIMLAGGTMHAHMSEMPVGTYKKAHRHGPDAHVFPVTGHGYSLFWNHEGDEVRRVDWSHGTVFAPPDQVFHQHFNTSRESARYLALAFGNLWSPITAEKRKIYEGLVRSVQTEGGSQIEYEDEDPGILELYVNELREQGIEPQMEAVLKRKLPVGEG